MTPTQAQLATRQLAKDAIEAFGATRATDYLSRGLTWSQMVAEHCQFLAFENERLRDRLALMDQAERMPLSQGGGDIVHQARKQGFADRINLR